MCPAGLWRCAPTATRQAVAPFPAPHPVLAFPGCRRLRSSATVVDDVAPFHHLLLLPRTPAPAALEEIPDGMEPRRRVRQPPPPSPTSPASMAAGAPCPPPVGGDPISTTSPREPTTRYSRPGSAEEQEIGVPREPGSGVDFGS
jgi:hypothetical protein